MATIKQVSVNSVFLSLLIAGAAQAQDEQIWSAADILTYIDPAKVQRIEPGAQPVGALAEALRHQTADDGAADPPALLNDSRIATLRSVAARLSASRTWLTSETLTAFEAQDLRLDELFARAPQFVTVDGKPYRIVVEQVGSLWEGFDPASDPFVVFLNHEIYDALGKDRAVAFENGQETVIFASDFQRIPALALTLERVAPEEAQPANLQIPPVDAAIKLGRHRLAIDRGPALELILDGSAEHAASGLGFDFTAGALSNVNAGETCSPQIAPSSCSAGKPVCGVSGYSPYFVVSAIKIKTDHEGCCFRGNPEIELFPLRLDATSASGGTTNPTTNLIFSGRTITDIAGLSRYLPDINDKNVWYNISNGLAVFPTNSGNEWSSTLVEDDEDTGVLKMNKTRVNVTKVYQTVTSIINDVRQLDFFFLLKAIQQFLDLIGLFNDGDDLYQESIGVANGLFCTNGLGQPFPKTFTLVSQEWEMKGYYACIKPSCTPPPPPPPPPGCFTEPCL